MIKVAVGSQAGAGTSRPLKKTFAGTRKPQDGSARPRRLLRAIRNREPEMLFPWPLASDPWPLTPGPWPLASSPWPLKTDN
jgi:hypothetical protein